ncbi:hypothetical protein B7494_g48 [Chlorociboria aeruginascens]|nr:hypothetical protein B7494_g48 [Chlorociboria aeruginascens]
MLVRAARRKAHQDTIRHGLLCEQLYLPFLYPAYNNAPNREQHRPISLHTPSPPFPARKRRILQEDGLRIAERRSLATAVSSSPFEDIPFEGLDHASNHGGSATYGHQSLLSRFAIPPPPPLTMDESIIGSAPKYRTNSRGVGGNLQEVLSVLDACLQVGRIQRAGVILKRITSWAILPPEEMTRIHNHYLRAAVYQIMVEPRESARQELHKWFELEIRLGGVQQNAETIAYMLKASLQSPAGNRRDRLIRRYTDMVESMTTLNECNVLTPHEVNIINHIYPNHNLTERHDESSDDKLETYSTETAIDDRADTLPIPPEVLATKQRGLGLKSLQKSLSLFARFPPSGSDMSTLSPQEQRNIQAQLEEDSVKSAIERWREESSDLTKMGMNTSLQTKSLGARMWKWHLKLVQRLKEELTKVEAAEKKEKMNNPDLERCQYGPFLRILPVEKLSALTILTSMSTLGSLGADRGINLATVITAIAKSVEDEGRYELLQKHTKVLARLNPDKADKYRSSLTLKRMSVRRSSKNSPPARDISPEDQEMLSSFVPKEWPMTISTKVGAFLMSALIDSARIPVSLEHPETGEIVTQVQPAFTHSFQYKLGKKIGVILANRQLVEQLKREPVHSLLAKHLPMLVSPEPWTQFNKGGFISHPTKVMRVKMGDKDQRNYAEAAISVGDMKQLFKGLDVLGSTSWRINQPVLNVMLKAWNTGDAIANIPPLNPNLPTPPEPEASNDPLERRRWIRESKLVQNMKGGLHSQRCFQNFQLEIARTLRNEVFYFPHNIDFRGRAYPIPPYLNHMGADHCRGLLRFGKGKQLGADGLKWLKIHLANVFGFDKASLKEREAFATDNLTKIYDSATNSLDGDRWWLEAEDPWQCLAACIELKSALDSPDPASFVSSLPIHQDGTCNGLQHYAALGGDVWGAQQVNLEPGDKPADVYSAVADIVRESVIKDLETGNRFAKVVHDKITRKIVKQTVMTNVYGVTYIGAKAQVRKQLTAAHDDLPAEPTLHAGILASYIATKIFSALSDMFRGAHDIQYWLGECANRICQSLTPEQIDRLEVYNATYRGTGKKFKNASEDPIQFQSSVIWTTPLNMPVVQPYRASKTKAVTTNLQHISISEPHTSDPVSKRKQLQGFPPNFIHSLDATHMLLSALECDKRGLSFAAVHDSFWTHASDIDTMNDVLRDSFIRIHSEDVIGRLAAEFSARYKNGMYFARVRAGSKVHDRIREFRTSLGISNEYYTKGTTRISELLTERKRLQLLQSSDPAMVEKGKKMITPGSIFEEMASEDDLQPSKEVKEIALGNVSSSEHLSKAAELDEPSETAGVDSTDEGDNDLSPAMCGFEKEVLTTTKRSRSDDTWVWLPMTLPPLPKKGDFDVSRLKNSKYFFS